ncbi:hypothetical protein BJY04DRAFT_225213 [Aspergillus karnatakaensis]|uniref:amidohydrolase family protein n=1 Tax=Aspergillus karnatakaensis TaxID=1810916 RepID=UPI003CCCC6D0
MATRTQLKTSEGHITLSTTNQNNSTSSYLHLLPPASFDTHVHVFDPTIAPYAPNRAYTPEDAPLQSLLTFNKRISQRGSETGIVLVQPSPYKADCTVLMRCLQELKARSIPAYAIAVVDLDTITDDELGGMHGLGVRGLRLNFQADGKRLDVGSLVGTLKTAAERIARLPGWVIQLFVPGWVWDELYECISALPVCVIADHLGGLKAASKLPLHLAQSPTSQPGFASLVDLARLGKVVVKVSGLYRASDHTESCFDDTRPIIQAFANEIPEQCIWGSDWPHTGEGKDRVGKGDLSKKEPFREIDDEGLLKNVREWVGGEVWEMMVRQNPGRVFR